MKIKYLFYPRANFEASEGNSILFLLYHNKNGESIEILHSRSQTSILITSSYILEVI